MKPSAKFSLRLCATVGAALLAGCAKAKANALLADRESKLGVSWKDYPAGRDDFPEHHYEKRFISVTDKSSGKWTYIDICRGGSAIAPALFDDVHPFREGLGAVQYDRKRGFVDMHGDILIPFDYEWNYPEIRDFDSELYAAGEFPFDYSAYTQDPVDIVQKTMQGLVFSFHALSKEERAPKKNQYATCYRVHISTKDGTELFPGRALYEEYFEDAI